MSITCVLLDAQWCTSSFGDLKYKVCGFIANHSMISNFFENLTFILNQVMSYMDIQNCHAHQIINSKTFKYQLSHLFTLGISIHRQGNMHALFIGQNQILSVKYHKREAVPLPGIQQMPLHKINK